MLVLHDRAKLQNNRNSVGRLFLSSRLTEARVGLGARRANQLATILEFCNGDWENEDEIEFWTESFVERNAIVDSFLQTGGPGFGSYCSVCVSTAPLAWR